MLPVRPWWTTQTAGPRGPALLQDIWLLEQNQASYFGTFGYGNPAYDNSGCMTPTAASFATGTSWPEAV